MLALDFSPDGKLLAAGGGEPSRSGELKIWEVGKGLLVRSLDSLHSDTVFALRFSPDGTKLASAAADKFLKVTNVADGKELRSFEGHTHHVMAVDWKSDGKQLITGGADKVLKLWDFDSGEQVRTLSEAGKQITAARWIAGKPEVVAASGDAQVRIWNPDSGGIARGFGGPSDYVYSVAASADGSRIAAGGADGVLFIWNGQNGQVLRKIEPPQSATGRTATHRTAENSGEAMRPVVAAIAASPRATDHALPDPGNPAELPGPHDQRLVEQPARLQVVQQGREGLVRERMSIVIGSATGRRVRRPRRGPNAP